MNDMNDQPAAASAADKGHRAEAAYERIKASIIRCELQPGQQVTEEQLAGQYGVSRGSIRPALKRLYQEQFIQLATRNRYFVAPITLKDANDVFEMRLLVEPHAARQAAGRIDAATLDRLRELSAVHYIPGDADSAEAFVRANTEFHVTIARATGNALLGEFVTTLLDREERINRLAHLIGDRNRDARNEHRDLVEALEARDGERAATVMTDGIVSARGFVLDSLLSSPALLTTNVAGPAAQPPR